MSMRVLLRHLQNGHFEKAHLLAQADDSLLGCWAHGIVHLQEGDLENARYWYQHAERDFPRGLVVESEVAALAAALEKTEL